MVFFNHATRQMTAKIVYYGPGLCGKTTNLNTIYGKTSQKARGEMVSLNTETDRTLFFDLLPLEVGVIGGFKTKLQLYTVPGQVFYNSTRKLVLKGVDGIVFVADSQIPMLDANKESLQNLDDNLRELGLDIRQIPMVFQWNKRDLKNVVPVEQLEGELNVRRQPSFQSIASDGTGVFETLRGITKLSLASIKTHHFPDTATGVEEAAPPPPPVIATPAAPAPQPLALSDLPSVGELLEDQSSAPREVPVIPRVAVPAATLARVTPATAPAKPGPLSAPKPMAPLKPMAQPRMAIAPLAPKPKPLVVAPPAKPKSAMAALLGENFAPSGGPSTVRIDLPNHLNGAELEVVIQVRQGGAVVAESIQRKPAPGEGGSSRLTIELKRS